MEDDGQEIGPVYLPGMLAPEAPKTTKSAEDTRREWELVKAGVSLADANKPLERDSWMTELPTSSKASINLGKMQRSVTRFRYAWIHSSLRISVGTNMERATLLGQQLLGRKSKKRPKLPCLLQSKWRKKLHRITRRRNMATCLNQQVTMTLEMSSDFF